MNLGAVVPQETAVLPLVSGTIAPFGGTAAQNEGERERGNRAVLPRRKGGTAAKEQYCRTTAAARYRTIRHRKRPLESTR